MLKQSHKGTPCSCYIRRKGIIRKQGRFYPIGCMQHNYQHVVGLGCYRCKKHWFFEEDWQTEECRMNVNKILEIKEANKERGKLRSNLPTRVNREEWRTIVNKAFGVDFYSIEFGPKEDQSECFDLLEDPGKEVTDFLVAYKNRNVEEDIEYLLNVIEKAGL